MHTAENGTDLPGELVRGGGRAGDRRRGGRRGVRRGRGARWRCSRRSTAASSYDGQGAAVVLTVHYEQDYDNAFWDGTQLVFGDGDGQVFGRFTKPVDVLGHEFTHAVTQFTANLTYQGQSGALNESVSDVFGSCLKQRLLGADRRPGRLADRRGHLPAAVHGRGAARRWRTPGTAYDDPKLGKDPQVGSMADYVDTTDDNGGRAHQLRHPQPGLPPRRDGDRRPLLGGRRQDLVRRADLGHRGRTPTSPGSRPRPSRRRRPSPRPADAVALGVGAGRRHPGGGHGRPGSPPTRAATPTVVTVAGPAGSPGVRRAGRSTLGDDPRTAEVESLIGRIDFRGVPPASRSPTGSSTPSTVRGEQVTVGEQDLTPAGAAGQTAAR